MKVRITQIDQGFMADCSDLPGSPPIGRGPTPEAAVIELFFVLMFSKIGGPSEDQSWLKYFAYEHGYSMTCDNYRPLIAVTNPTGSNPTIQDIIKRAADEITNGHEEVPDRDKLEEILTRHFNHPFGLTVGHAVPAEDNGSSPKPPDEPQSP